MALFVSYCPEFFDKYDYRKLDSKCWCEFLFNHPEYIDECDLDMLEEDHVAFVLQIYPYLITEFDYKNFSGPLWISLLTSQPQFKDYCPVEQLSLEE